MQGSLPANSVPPDPQERRISLSEVGSSVRKHWILVISCFVIVLAVVGLITASTTRMYEAEATIYFDPRPPQPLGGDVEPVIDTSADYWNRKEYYNTQHWILTSRATLEPVVLKLRLHFDRGFVRNRPEVDRVQEQLLPPSECATLLASRMKVSAVADSRLAKVTYRDANPTRAAEVLSAITKTYIGQNEEELLSATTEASTWLHGQVSVLRDDLEKSEVALNDYKKDKNLLSVSLDDQSNMLREEIQRLNGALTDAKAKRQQVAARANALGSLSEENPSELPARELLESAVLQELRAQFVSAKRDLDGLSGSGKGAKHPDVIAAEARFQTTRGALLDEVKNIKRSLSRDVQATDMEIGGLQRLFNDARDRALEINKLEIEYKRIRRTRDTNERLFSIVTERSKESDLARLLRANNVRVVDAPVVPKVPVSPNLPLNLLGATAAGLLLGLAGAVARESMDRTIRGPEDAEGIVGLPLLGMLPASGATKPSYGRRREKTPKSSDDSLDLLAHESPTSTFAEAARAVRTSIVFSSPDRPIRTLLVTSAVAGDGKTTVACNLAITMAQAGQRVVLIDCDLRRSRLHGVFSVENNPGVTGVIVGPRSIESGILATAVPNLSLLTSGALPPNPSELLHSEAFGQLLESLKKQFDIVIIDSPPLVPVTDAAVISTRIDSVVLVARAFKTSRAAAQRAVRILRDVNANTVGVVLNGFDSGRSRYGYYGYREQGYAPRTESTPPPAA